MSFSAKNLSYEAKEPVFLQRLRNQYGGTAGRLERPAARPKRAIGQAADEDDEPTYVDEESNEVVSKQEYEAMVNATITAQQQQQQQQEQQVIDMAAAEGMPGESARKSSPPADPASSKPEAAEIGVSRKRRLVKAIGDEGGSSETGSAQLGESKPPPHSPQQPEPKKNKRKGKKIKLSFDEQ